MVSGEQERGDLDGRTRRRGSKLEVGGQQVHHHPHLVVRQNVGFSPPPVHSGARRSVLASECACMPTRCEVVQVAGGGRDLSRDDLVAAAIEADRVLQNGRWDVSESGCRTAPMRRVRMPARRTCASQGLDEAGPPSGSWL